jgi:nucleotide-binding universal stress UspA family protein
MSTIVTGYDGSAAADAALAASIDLAKRFGDDLVVAFGFEANPVGGELTDYRKALEEHGQRVIDTALERAKAAGVEATPAIVSEEPAHALADLGRARDARVIVVGSRGEGPVRAALLGSTPNKLLHLADRPVLVVPAAG